MTYLQATAACIFDRAGLITSPRHCEERSDEAIQSASETRAASAGLLRFARNDGGAVNQASAIAERP
jgi:hypothetical protein